MSKKKSRFEEIKENIVGGIVLVSGIAIGAISTYLYFTNKPKKASEALSNAKEYFARDTEVIGSWIDYDSVPYEIFDDAPLVYIGGITKVEDGKNVQYQFASDIYTGEVIDYFKVEN